MSSTIPARRGTRTSQVYALCHRAENAPTLDDQPGAGLIEKRVSKAFAALLKRDEDRATQSHAICALDWDFVIDGQAWRLTNVKAGALVVAGDKATVTASFRNFGACVNIYDFVREHGQWKLDDVETKSGSQARMRIANRLRDFDDTR